MYNDFHRAQSVERQVDLSLKWKDRSKKLYLVFLLNLHPITYVVFWEMCLETKYRKAFPMKNNNEWLIFLTSNLTIWTVNGYRNFQWGQVVWDRKVGLSHDKHYLYIFNTHDYRQCLLHSCILTEDFFPSFQRCMYSGFPPSPSNKNVP